MKSNSLIVRQYQESDKDAVWELHHLALGHTGALLRDGLWDDDLHNIQEVYISNNGEFLVGLWNMKIVCMGAFRKKTSGMAEIKRMRVHPDFQKRGFGQTILTMLEERAKILGYTELCLDTTTLQLPAQKLYEKNGYFETHRGYVGGFDLIFYAKKL